MIEFKCDRCEKVFDVTDDKAGTKFECPDCGDMNIVPSKPTPAPSEPTSHAERVLDEKGLPPDDGPETEVLTVRPSIWRGSPFRCGGLALIPVAVPLALYLLLGELEVGNPSKAGWWTFLVVATLSWGWLAIWWIAVSIGQSFEITNKRTIQRRGIIRRSTSEVMHDHVRNIQIDQSVLDRVLNVGQIGISSSGQDGIEVQMKDLPRPGKLKEIIDAYRPM